jgi:hypothetical protein
MGKKKKKKKNITTSQISIVLQKIKMKFQLAQIHYFVLMIHQIQQLPYSLKLISHI